jgi:hypothetical protein
MAKPGDGSFACNHIGKVLLNRNDFSAFVRWCMALSPNAWWLAPEKFGVTCFAFGPEINCRVDGLKRLTAARQAAMLRDGFGTTSRVTQYRHRAHQFGVFRVVPIEPS